MKPRTIQIWLSVFVLFHLTAVVISPGGPTFLGKTIEPWIKPYVNTFELASSWSFFAPEPGPPPIHVVYEVESEKRELVKAGTFPETGDPFFFRDRQNRRIAAARFMLSGQDRLEKVMVPYLCRTVPGAYSVRVGQQVHMLPSLQDVADGKRHIGDGKQIETKWVSTTFCKQGAI
jgi:hypothetical protein